MKKWMILIVFAGLSFMFQTNEANSQNIDPDLTGMRAIGTPANPKVPWTWNYYMDYAAYTKLSHSLTKAFPNLVKETTIGKTTQGRDMIVMTISDFKSGNSDEKPGFWIDGSIHANEMQGVQFAMYTAWYLAESFGKVEFITQLLKDKTFYILPSVNPDGRENFIYKANTPHSSRSGMRPFDDDGDLLVDEDTYNDLDGDGNITSMRRRNPNGRWKEDPNFPMRMIPAGPDEEGGWEMLGNEGYDMDGDGRVNEDAPGTYDGNRDWAWNWQPDYIQRGALFYPGTLSETRNIKDFVMAHPNIAGAQSYHNNGGMLLRGAGAKEDQQNYNRADDAVYDLIGKLGEKILPGYHYYVIWKDLYTVYGGEIDWFGITRGAFTFSNEIFNSYSFFHSKGRGGIGFGGSTEFNEFDKYLLFGDAYVAWKPFKHPQFGDIEIGGGKKNYTRNTPGFMLEEEGHRNMAFTIFHAYNTPKLEIVDFKTKSIAKGLTEVTVVVANKRAIPTHSSFDIKHKIERPDFIILKNAEVLAGMIVENEDMNLVREQKSNPSQISVPNIPGTVGGGFGGPNNSVKVRWIVKGSPKTFSVEVNSRKGGVVRKDFKP